MGSQKEKVKKYIEEQGYSWTYDQIISEYIYWKNGHYISFTARKVINACIDDTCQVYT